MKTHLILMLSISPEQIEFYLLHVYIILYNNFTGTVTVEKHTEQNTSENKLECRARVVEILQEADLS